MKNRNLFILVFPLLIVTFGSCKKDDETIKPSDEVKIFEIEQMGETTLIDIPQKLSQSNDPYAQICAGYIEQANELLIYTQMFRVPDYAVKVESENEGSDESVTYTWAVEYGENSYIVWLTFTEYDNSYKYVMDLDTGQGRESYMACDADKDGRNGNMTVHLSPLGMTGTMDYNWTYEDNGDFVFQMTSNDNSSEYDYLFTVHPDNSGEVSYSVDNAKSHDMTWEADGSGTWVYYESDGTTVSMQGTWS